MDTDPIIASALDIIADEATVKNDVNEILQIKSSDENIQRVLYNLFYDVLNIEFNLWSWNDISHYILKYMLSLPRESTCTRTVCRLSSVVCFETLKRLSFRFG